MQRTLISVIAVALAIATFFMWTKPMWGEIRATKARMADLDVALSDAREIQAARDELLTTFNTIPKEGVDRINHLLPSSVSSVQFIIEIENLVRKQGLILKSIDVVDPESSKTKVSKFTTLAEPFERIPLSITVAGSYSAFVSFLDQLSRSLRLVDVETVGFSASKEDSYEFDIGAVTYWKPTK